jgi:hypothetical protein
MAVRDLRSQEAQNDAGVIVRGVDRETMQLEHQGRTLNFGVDRAPGSYGIYLAARPVWNDGTAVDAAELPVLRAAIVEILGHWGIQVEFIN